MRNRRVKEGFFFFEKKKQKTFIHFGEHPCRQVEPFAGRHLQKFFASFFQKRRILPLITYAILGAVTLLLDRITAQRASLESAIIGVTLKGLPLRNSFMVRLASKGDG